MKTFEERISDFLKIVKENPTLPIYFWVDYEVVGGDDYSRWLGEIGKTEVDVIAFYNELFFKDEDELIQEYYNQHDEEFLGWKECEIDAEIKIRTNHLWKPVILVNVELPDSINNWED